MFKKANRSPTTILAAGTHVSGGLKTNGNVHVDGTIEGTVDVDGDLSVGSEARIDGSVTGRNVTVAGHIHGRVRVDGLLRILKGGVVADDVVYDTLEVEKGGSIQGRAASADQVEDADAAGANEMVEVGKMQLLKSVPPSATGRA